VQATKEASMWIGANQFVGSKWIKTDADLTSAALKITKFIRFVLLCKRVRLPSVLGQHAMEVLRESAERTARADRLLAVFEINTEYMKAMAAVEFWGLIINKDPLLLALPLNREKLEQWPATKERGQPVKDAFPRVDDISTDDTIRLERLWADRGSISTLPEHLHRAAKAATRLSFKRFLAVLRQGRQLYSNFHFMNPELDPLAVRSTMDLVFYATVSWPQVEEQQEKSFEKFCGKRRAQASYAKRKQLEEEEEKKREEEAQLDAKKKRLEEDLDAAVWEAEAKAQSTPGARTRSQRDRDAPVVDTPKIRQIGKAIGKVTKQTTVVKKARVDKQTQAKELEKEEQAATMEAEAVIAPPLPKPKRKRTKQGYASLHDLVREGDSVPPIRTHQKKQIQFESPGPVWLELACHKVSLLECAHATAKEAAHKGELTIDWSALKQQQRTIQDSKNLAQAKQLLLDQGSFEKDQKRKPTPEEFALILRAGNYEYLEVTLFMKKAFAALGMIDVVPFLRVNGTYEMKKISQKYVSTSLAKWMTSYLERKQLYALFNLLEQLASSLQTEKLNAVLKKRFNTEDRGELVEMIGIVTKGTIAAAKNAKKRKRKQSSS